MERAGCVIGGLDGMMLQFVRDRNWEQSRRDLEHLTAVITLAEGAAPLKFPVATAT
jgi:hypothetical protein